MTIKEVNGLACVTDRSAWEVGRGKPYRRFNRKTIRVEFQLQIWKTGPWRVQRQRFWRQYTTTKNINNGHPNRNYLYLRYRYRPRYRRNFNGTSGVYVNEELKKVSTSDWDNNGLYNRKWLDWRSNWYISISGCLSLSKLLEYTFVELVSLPLFLVFARVSDVLCLSV